MKKRPKSSINTSNKKYKSRRDTDLFSTFNMKTAPPKQLVKNGTEENLSNDQIY